MTETRTTAALSCVVCGHEPAAKVTFRGHEGIVIFFHMLKVEGPLCRDCGTTYFRETTALTLFRGWWSPFSFFIAPVVLVLNLLSRRKVADLPQPVRSEFVAPNLEPMQPVRPVLARPTSWIGPVLLIAVVLFLALRQPQTPRAVPECALAGALVDCAQPHDFRVVSEVEAPQECARAGYESLEVRMRYYCLSPERTL